MPRVKRGTVRRAHRQKLAKLTKGYFLKKSKLYKFMKEAADRAGRFAYRDRRRRKRDFRRLWITRISAGARAHELTYSQFIFGLKKLGIALDRKVLAEMAARDAAAFAELASKVKKAVESQESKVASHKSAS
jgi:large subunit ribosomal protein L20